MTIDTETNSRWEPVKQMMAGAPPVELGPSAAALAGDQPHEWLARLSAYKFAARMIGQNARVLDVNCADGMGTWILHKECGSAQGIHPDHAAIETARRNWGEAGVVFHHGDISSLREELFDAVALLNETQSIRDPDTWLAQVEAAVAVRLKPYGVAVLAAVCDVWNQPELTTEQPPLRQRLGILFSQVFVFSRFGELIRAGRHLGADGLLILACRNRAITRDTCGHDQAPSTDG